MCYRFLAPVNGLDGFTNLGGLSHWLFPENCGNIIFFSWLFSYFFKPITPERRSNFFFQQANLIQVISICIKPTRKIPSRVRHPEMASWKQECHLHSASDHCRAVKHSVIIFLPGSRNPIMTSGLSTRMLCDGKTKALVTQTLLQFYTRVICFPLTLIGTGTVLLIRAQEITLQSSSLQFCCSS